MNNEFHVFEYHITIEQTLKTLIQNRFGRLFKRTNMTIDEFIANRITVNQKREPINFQLQIGDIIQFMHFRYDEIKYLKAIQIIYEDESILAVEKPDCLSVTPNTTYYFNSVLNLLKTQLNNAELSPLHRLDIETSGVLLFSKRKEERSQFQKLFEANLVLKYYRTVVYGKFPDTINSISGDMVRNKNSGIYSKFRLNFTGNQTVTKIMDVQSNENFSQLIVSPISGFTNQIRCHLAAMGHSIIGDKKYYPDESVYLKWYETDYFDKRMILDHHVLHCESVKFTHPLLNKLIIINSDSKLYENKSDSIRNHFTER